MQEIETMTQFVDIGVELKSQFVCASTADTCVKHGATLPLLALLVEHDPVQPASKVMVLRYEKPNGPLWKLFPQGEVLLHRRM
jgi:hypothetical protein